MNLKESWEELNYGAKENSTYSRLDNSGPRPDSRHSRYGRQNQEKQRLVYSCQPNYYSSPVIRKAVSFTRIEAAKDGQAPLLRCTKKVVLLFLVVSSTGIAYPTKQIGSAGLLSLKRAAHVLDEISKKSQNSIPDAVLNSTRCIVVIPSITGGTVNVSRTGVTECREPGDKWSAPSLVKFDPRVIWSRRTDLLIFVLSDRGVRALRSGELQIGGQKRGAAPLVTTTPITTQVELTAEFLAYENTAGGLSSSEASGVIRRDPDISGAVDKTMPRKTIEKYMSSVVSFFNTITATGIVIHHTAVIPGEKKVPRSQRDIDEYHQARGFEILCFGRTYHVAYHYLIMANGSVRAGRPERCEGAHAQGYNSYLGISVVGDFSSEDNPTGRQGTGQTERKADCLSNSALSSHKRPLQHSLATHCPAQ